MLTTDEQAEYNKRCAEIEAEILARRVPKIDQPTRVWRCYIQPNGKPYTCGDGVPPIAEYVDRLAYFRTEAEALDQDRHEQAYRRLRRSWKECNPGGAGMLMAWYGLKTDGGPYLPWRFESSDQYNQFLSMPGVTEGLKTLYEQD